MFSSLCTPPWLTPTWDHPHPHSGRQQGTLPIHRSRGDALSSSETANITINTNHNKALITAAPSLHATKGALPYKRGLADHSPQEYPELHLPGPGASHILHPQPELLTPWSMTSPIYLPAAEPWRVDEKVPSQPCLFMLSQDVAILPFMLPVPAKLREKWEGAGDLQQQQQQHVGPSSSALTLLGPGEAAAAWEGDV